MVNKGQLLWQYPFLYWNHVYHCVLCSGISALTSDAPTQLQTGSYPKASEEAMEFIETVGEFIAMDASIIIVAEYKLTV